LKKKLYHLIAHLFFFYFCSRELLITLNEIEICRFRGRISYLKQWDTAKVLAWYIFICSCSTYNYYNLHNILLVFCLFCWFFRYASSFIVWIVIQINILFLRWWKKKGWTDHMFYYVFSKVICFFCSTSLVSE
jgi:hypothetical protein